MRSRSIKNKFKKVNPDAVSIIKQLNRTETIFEFGLPFIIVLREQITVPLSLSSFLYSVSSRFVYFVIFLKNMTCSMPTWTACLIRYTVNVFKYGTPYAEVVYRHIKQVHFLLSKQEKHTLRTLPAILFQKIKHGTYVKLGTRMKSSTFESESLSSLTDRLDISNLILGSTQITFVELNWFINTINIITKPLFLLFTSR